MRTLRILLSLAVVSVLFFASCSQTIFGAHLRPATVTLLGSPPTEWSRAFAGNGWDESIHGRIDWIYSMVQTIDGGYALAGHTTSLGTEGWLIKTDVEGNALWNKTYRKAGLTEARPMVQTSDAGYAMAGAGESVLLNNSEYQNTVCLVKTDANGTLLWNWTYVDASSRVATSMVQTSDGGYALACWLYPGAAGSYDFCLVKTDASGTLLWNRTYGGTGFDAAYSVVQTVDGGYALAGSTKSFSSDEREDIWLVKTDAEGNMLWNRTYGGTGDDRAYSVVQTTDGCYALAGTSEYFTLMKTDADGNLLWNRALRGGATSMVQTDDGGFILAGFTISEVSDFWLAKTDANGKLLWVNDDRSLFGFGAAFSVIQTIDGGYAMAGSTMRAGDTGTLVDGWLVKLGANPRLVGDFTGPDDLPDGKVDMRDIGLIAIHFRETVPPADPSWDIYQNGEIDNFDISVVARNFGDHYP